MIIALQVFGWGGIWGERDKLGCRIIILTRVIIISMMIIIFLIIIIVDDEKGMFIIVIVIIINDHICHKQYKQRLCKVIITRVKADFVGVF